MKSCAMRPATAGPTILRTALQSTDVFVVMIIGGGGDGVGTAGIATASTNASICANILACTDLALDANARHAVKVTVYGRACRARRRLYVGAIPSIFSRTIA